MEAGNFIHGLIFYFLAGVILSSGIVVARARNLVYSAMGLLFTFFGIAGIFVYAHADFVAGIQIVVYIGGILVLILFGIMLTRRKGGVKVPNEITGSYAARLIPVGVTVLLLTVVLTVDWQKRFPSSGQNPNLWSQYDAGAPEGIKKQFQKQKEKQKDETDQKQAPEQNTEKSSEKSPSANSGSGNSNDQTVPWGTIDAIGESMMGKYLIAFEEISVLLLVALLGAVYLARRPTQEELDEAHEVLNELEEEST